MGSPRTGAFVPRLRRTLNINTHTHTRHPLKAHTSSKTILGFIYEAKDLGNLFFVWTRSLHRRSKPRNSSFLTPPFYLIYIIDLFIHLPRRQRENARHPPKMVADTAPTSLPGQCLIRDPRRQYIDSDHHRLPPKLPTSIAIINPTYLPTDNLHKTTTIKALFLRPATTTSNLRA